MMMRGPIESRRVLPLIVLGPGGQYVDRLYIQGRAIVRPHEPAPPAPALLQPATAPRQITRQRWRWSRMGLGVLLAIAITLLAALLLVAIVIALLITPAVVGSRKL